MTKKKVQKVSVSQPDEAEAQPQLGRFHQVAQKLHSTNNQEQAEAAITAITSMSEGAQVALLKALSREHHTDAADVLSAINQLSPIKDIRKEARRSLIRLEQDRIYPQWEAPVDRTPAIVMQNMYVSSTPPRFWKGIVTDSRDAGEVQLMLFWEQGDTYRDVRVLGFLLEFWHDGVKDFFTSIQSKRSVDKLMGELQATVETLDCSLAKGRRLIQEALDVNKKHSTIPHKDYRLHASLVNQLVLEAPGIDEEEEEENDSSPLDLNNLEPDQVVTGFVDSWAGGDYKFAYNLLADDSPLREGLTEEQWIERREAWAAEAHPLRLKPNFLHEIETQKTALWLPNPFSRGQSTSRKEIEAGWSLELADTSLPLPELPRATAVYQETRRHWFWTSYALEQGENGWRIQTMTDAGTNAQGLSIAEIQKRIGEHDRRIEDITKKHRPTDPDAAQYFAEILWRSMQAIYYDDALLARLPLDQAIYLDASGRAIILMELERGLVYLERMAQQFPEQRGETLREIAAVQLQLSEEFYTGEEEYDFEDEDEEEAEERGQHFVELAETTVRESLNIDDSASGHILLADMLIENGDEEKLDEAEEHLLQAQALPTSQVEETLIESKLGDVYAEREHYEQALAHYQRVIEIDPNFSGAWYNIGQTYKMLENNEEAKAAFKRSIALNPDDVESYAELVEIYTGEGQISEARDLLEEGLSANPDSAHLLVLLSSTYFDDDPEHAEELLEEAEEIGPDLMIVQLYRQIFNMRKQEQRRQPSFRGKKRKKR